MSTDQPTRVYAVIEDLGGKLTLRHVEIHRATEHTVIVKERTEVTDNRQTVPRSEVRFSAEDALHYFLKKRTIEIANLQQTIERYRDSIAWAQRQLEDRR